MAYYDQARELMAELGLNRSWTDATLVAEALKRDVKVTAVKLRPRLVFHFGDAKFRWQGGRTTLNSPLAITIARYKDLQSRLFLNHGINAPEGAVFQAGQAERAWKWAEPLGTLVVKPHRGTHGNDVHVGIDTWHSFEEAFHRVSRDRGQALVEKFHTGIEHRCLVVDGRLVAVTRRRPASVKGNGTSTIRELVRKKNFPRGKIHKRIELGQKEYTYLRKQGLSFDSVPHDGERVYLLGTSNIHTGGDAIDATKEITAPERAEVERAARSIPGLRLVGLDVLLPRSPGDSEQTVIEINHAPMTSMHHFPWEGRRRNVSAAIIDAMFPESKTTPRRAKPDP